MQEYYAIKEYQNNFSALEQKSTGTLKNVNIQIVAVTFLS